MRFPQQLPRSLGPVGTPVLGGTGRKMRDVRTTTQIRGFGVTSSSNDRPRGVGDWLVDGAVPRKRTGLTAETSVSAGGVGTSRPSPCGFSRSGKVREGSTTTDPTGSSSRPGIVPTSLTASGQQPAPLHVRSRASGPGPNPFRPRYAPRVSTAEHASFGAARCAPSPNATASDPSVHSVSTSDRPEPREGDRRGCGVGPGTVVEIGAGLGSLTRALAEAGAEVLAVEVDPR